MCPSSHHLFLWNCDWAQADFQSRSGAPDFCAILPLCSATWQSKSYSRWESMSPGLPDEMMLESEKLPLSVWSPRLSFLVGHSACWETVLPSLHGDNFSPEDDKRGGTRKWGGIGMKKHGCQEKVLGSQLWMDMWSPALWPFKKYDVFIFQSQEYGLIL